MIKGKSVRSYSLPHTSSLSRILLLLLLLTIFEAQHRMIARIEQCHTILWHQRFGQFPRRRRIRPASAERAWNLRPLAATFNVARPCRLLRYCMHIDCLEEFSFTELGQHQWPCTTAQPISGRAVLHQIHWLLLLSHSRCTRCCCCCLLLVAILWRWRWLQQHIAPGTAQIAVHIVMLSYFHLQISHLRAKIGPA